MSTIRLHPDTMREAVRRVPFLARLSPASIEALVSLLGARRLGEDEVLYKEGDPGDALMMVVSGRLSVRVRSTASTQDAEVAAVYPGEVVGEMACVDPGPRSATVVATEITQVLELTRSTMRVLMSNAPEVAVAVHGAVIQLLSRRLRDTNSRIEAEMERRGVATASKVGSVPTSSIVAGGEEGGRIDLKRVTCLKDFDNRELEALIKAAPPRRFADGTVLCREGDVGDSCFILARGCVAVVRNVGGMERTLALLETGALVGQMALVDGAPRSATIRVKGDAIILILHRRAFEQLLNAAHPFAVKFQEQIAIAGARQMRLANVRFSGLVTRPAQPAKAPIPGARPASDIVRMDPARSGEPPRLAPGTKTEDQRMGEMLSYMQTALGEWNLSLEDIEQVRFETPEGTRPPARRP